MTLKAKNLRARAARDQLIELSGVGKTYPLRDTPVRDDLLTVPFNTTAKIPIENSQPGVLYQLHHDREPVLGDDGKTPIEMRGNGETLLLTTSAIDEDKTFEILAIKPSGYQAYLINTATVKVGLDVTLRAWVTNAAHLDPSLADPQDTKPRLIPYNTHVMVTIADSQEGVDYKLVDVSGKTETEFSVDDGLGNLSDIELQSLPLQEDIDLRIRATKVFDRTEQRETQTTLLDVVIPVRVQPNPALSVQVVPSAIAPYGGDLQIELSDTQQSATYQLFVRPLNDPDYLRHDGADGVQVDVPNEPAIIVTAPPTGGALPEGYTPVGDVIDGNAGTLSLPLPNIVEDLSVIIQANKQHAEGVSALTLAQAMAVLVEPNRTPELQFIAMLDDDGRVAGLQAVSGEQGVFYTVMQEGEPIGQSLYIHRHVDDTNVGLGQITIDVDMVVARGRVAEGNLASTPPASPLMNTNLSTGVELPIRAMRAQTRVATSLAHPLPLPEPPNIQLKDPVVDFSGETKIIVQNSVEGDKYQPYLDGEVFKRALNGNGKNLSFNTDDLSADTTYEVHITPSDNVPIPVERRLTLTARVRPDHRLAVTTSADTVGPEESVQIHIEGSQSGVDYQLTSEGAFVGTPVAGGDDVLTLVSPPITATTTFSISAVRQDITEIWTVLATQVTTTLIEPEPEPPAEEETPAEEDAAAPSDTTDTSPPGNEGAAE